jgi:MFS family permease
MTATDRRATGASGRPRSKRGKRPRDGVGWWPVFVIAAVSLIDRIETSILTGVLPLLQEEWGFSDTAGGAIPTAVTIAGLLVALPAGYLADRANRTNLLAIVVASWSVITLASGMAISFAMFFATRVVLGAADNLDIPSQSSLLGDYYPPEERPKVFGIQRMVYFVGIGLGSLLGGAMGQFFGWRWAFFSMIVPGLIVAYWCYRLREPVRGEIDRLAAERARDARAARATGSTADTPVAHRGDQEAVGGGLLTPEPADDAAGTGEAAATGTGGSPLEGGWRGLRSQIAELFRSRTLRFLFAALVVLFLGLNGIFYWLPSSFVRAWDVGPAIGGVLTALIIIIGVITGTLIGSLIGRRWHGIVPGIRVTAGGIGFTLGGVLMGAGFLSPTLGLQVTLLVLATASMSIAIPNHFAAAADCISPRNRGVGFTLVQVGTAVGSSFGPLIVGAVSDRTGSLQLSFYSLVVPIVIAGLVVLGGRRSYEADAAKVLEDSLEGR